jgi:heavy metal translocating P-type ATPase
VKRTYRFFREYYQFSVAVLAIIVSLALQFSGHHTALHWTLGTVSIAAVFPLLNDMWQDVRAGSYGIDILAATAIVTSVLLHQYWAAIVIVVMLTGGAALEDFAEHRAKTELDALLKRAPQLAHVIRARKTIDVKVGEVKAGDHIIIRPGEVVPVDALILDGTASFDESSLTGESLPQVKNAGEQILSGSVNLDGAITAKALHSAHDSQYEQIIRLVRSAAAAQAPFVRLADRYSIPFTIMAYTIAAAAWVIGGHAIRFLEVIVVATPCPLLLAAPIALISGMSRASKYGIIVRTGSALEKLAEAKTFAFDKTGTLTSGKPTIDTITAYGKHTRAEVLGLAASLEQSSNHVLAAAIVEAAKAKQLKIAKAKHISESAGHGLKATLQGKEILVGHLRFMQDHGVTLPPKFSASSIKQTTALVSSDGELIGAISFKDELRPDSKQLLDILKKLGIRHTLMVTGDNSVTAHAVAKQLGISNVRAEALPGDKLHAIEHIEDRPVAFVGDGVNDAPVLTAADIGIALGARGSTAASESADLIIMSDNLSLVGRALAIAKRTFAIARQSILIGIALSVVLMIIFSTGRFTPLLGALLQEVVDVVVIFNALRAHLSPKTEL